MDKAAILQQTERYVQETLAGDGSGHDWWHMFRVRNIALTIGREESADLFVVELGALLHDIADWKFHDGDTTVGPRVAREWLQKIKVEEEIIAQVCSIVQDISFKGAGVKTPMKTKEGMVVQDADRLDALGAIGIGRAFAYGGSKGREMYNPNIPPTMHVTFEEYKKSNTGTINHFYEKLLLLQDMMNTTTGKRMAGVRHVYMEKFLEQFFQEWEGKA